MNYAHVENGAVSAYPFADWQLRQHYSNTSFPSEMTDAVRAEWNMLAVVEQLPGLNVLRQYATQKATHLWTVSAGKVHVTYTVHDWTLAERRERLIADLKQKRWEVETSGVQVDIGGEPVIVSTARGDDRSALHMEFSRLLSQTRPDGATFNFADTKPRAVSNADMMAAIQTALGFVQAAFDREKDVTALIDGAHTHDAMDLATGEIEIGWPGDA